MRLYLSATIALIFLFSCNNNSSNAVPAQQNAATTDTGQQSAEKPHFFPVTAYLKGQLYEIKEKGLTPMHYITVNDHTDSSYLKLDGLEQAVHEFVTPQIDTTNLTAVFTESSFLDQTINAFTFTYNPKGELPDSIPINHWDVYIDPETQKVKRIYIVKNLNSTILQLTWQSGEWCKIVTLDKTPDGGSKVIKEEKIVWTY
ncbi:MAG: hypothetical protein JST86_07295 [Bacteroidetes bacterium]|nr:hypothetical protein [Bacteroidota bacterium]